jgi:hypothetical protein
MDKCDLFYRAQFDYYGQLLYCTDRDLDPPMTPHEPHRYPTTQLPRRSEATKARTLVPPGNTYRRLGVVLWVIWGVCGVRSLRLPLVLRFRAHLPTGFGGQSPEHLRVRVPGGDRAAPH